MGNSHNGRADELDRRLKAALVDRDDEEVRNLLAEIGKAELSANAPKKRVRPSPTDSDLLL